MKNFNAIILTAFALVASIGGVGACSSSNASVNNNPANTPPARTDATNSAKPSAEPANSPAPVVAEKTPEKTSNVSTPTAAYKAAYAARKNKDIEALKKLMTKDALEFLSMMTDAKSDDEALRQMTAQPQGATDESRNEKITGDQATLEYPDADGKWKTMYLAKEDGVWKLTMPKADAMKKFESKNSK
jgi:predicted lipid-binding transport protein (Tim44 family)